MDKNKAIIFVVIGASVLIAVAILYGILAGGGSPEDPRATLEAELDFWGVFDEEIAYRTAIESFNATYPNVRINYRRFDSVDDYERTLLNALAAGEGPDIFMIRNNDLKRKKNKIVPIPSNKYSLLNLNREFPDIVEKNFVENESLYALPLSIDTLSLIYNKDILSNNQIVFPPETWNEFVNDSSNITEFDNQGNITLYGSAMGATNVDRSKDILSLIMIQSGSEMINDSYTSISFNYDNRFNPLNFYTSFARNTSGAYSWSRDADNSLEEFREGNIGMVFGYHSDFQEIRNQRPSLNVEVASTPDFEENNTKTSYAHYWGYSVSRQTEYPNAAIDFVVNMTSNTSNARSYLNVTDRPPALSGLVQNYLEDPEMNVYASQILTAESWSEPNPERVSEVFDNMIERVLNGEDRARESIGRARADINNLIDEL